MKEVDMFPAIGKWLQDQGYKVYTEVPHSGGCLDVAGLCPETKFTIGIEMKLCLSRGVMVQAMRASTNHNHAYCAVATKPRSAGIDRCKTFQVGLLCVHDDKVQVVVEPQDKSWGPQRLYELSKLEKMTPGGVAGMPTQKGCGPAQDCAALSKEYFKSNQGATWKDAFRDIPNHYSSHASMRGSLRSRGLI